MGVKLRIARRQERQEPGDEGFVHARILQQAKDNAGMADAETPQDGPRTRGEQMMNEGVKEAIAPVARGKTGVEPKGIKGQTQVFDAESGCVGDEDSKHGRVQVQMQMAVDMIEG